MSNMGFQGWFLSSQNPAYTWTSTYIDICSPSFPLEVSACHSLSTAHTDNGKRIPIPCVAWQKLIC